MRRRVVFAGIPALIFSAFLFFGASLQREGTAQALRQLPWILLLTPALTAVILLLYMLLEKADRADKPETGILLRKKWLIPLILLACWLPAFIAEFPGGFRYDAAGEYLQVLYGYEGDYPLLHSAIVTTLIPLAKRITGVYDAGVAAWVLFQMVCMALMYTHILRTLIRRGVHRGVIWAGLAYCALFPVIQMLAVQMLRDVLFAALLTYTVFCLYLLRTDREAILGNPRKAAGCAVVLSLTLLARGNMGILFLILVILVSACVWVKNRKAFFRGATVWAVTGIGSFLLIGWILTLICRPMVKEADRRVTLAVFSQAVTRTYLEEGEHWTEAEREELAEYMDLEGIRYYPKYGDETKNRIRPDADLGRFVVFCLRMGVRYPGTALNAVLAQTQDMWYPPSVVDGYKQRFTEEGDPYWEYEKNYFAIEASNDSPAHHLNLLPGLLNFYTDIGLRISFERIPVIDMLFSIGAQFWIVILQFMYLWYRRKTRLLLPAGVMLAYMIACAFVPIVLLRYFAAVFLCMPMILAFVAQPSRCEGKAAEK